MALTLKNDLCREIEAFRINDDTPTEGTTARKRISWSLRHSQQRERAVTFSGSVDVPEDRYTSRQPHLLQRTTRRILHIPARRKSSSLYLPQSRDDTDGGNKTEGKILMTGWLYKTSQLKTSETRGHRQHRKFKLTAHSLEYSHFLLKVGIAIVI